MSRLVSSCLREERAEREREMLDIDDIYIEDIHMNKITQKVTKNVNKGKKIRLDVSNTHSTNGQFVKL